MKQKRDSGGWVALSSLLIVSAVVLSITISVSLQGVDQLQMALGNSRGLQAYYLAVSCIETGLLALRDSGSYSGQTLQPSAGSCTVTVTGSGANRTLVSTGTVFGPPEFTRQIEVRVKRTDGSITILTWQEI